jgi:hypothetical protein
MVGMQLLGSEIDVLSINHVHQEISIAPNNNYGLCCHQSVNESIGFHLVVGAPPIISNYYHIYLYNSIII